MSFSEPYLDNKLLSDVET